MAILHAASGSQILVIILITASITAAHEDKGDSKLLPTAHEDKGDSKLLSTAHENKGDSKLLSTAHENKGDSKLLSTVSRRSCTDTAGWYATWGALYNCAWYASSSNSRCANYGNSNANQGQTASQACCACGGGKMLIHRDMPSSLLHTIMYYADPDG